uniref:Uncharacterized protein n=1 Tax=Rhizophora mucronata TaxID=61149 RepID=A0A2P2M9A1_RHIMU
MKHQIPSPTVFPSLLLLIIHHHFAGGCDSGQEIGNDEEIPSILKRLSGEISLAGKSLGSRGRKL